MAPLLISPYPLPLDPGSELRSTSSIHGVVPEGEGTFRCSLKHNQEKTPARGRALFDGLPRISAGWHFHGNARIAVPAAISKGDAARHGRR
jgi:hypothetical protein